jgi:hypothetical protein
LILPVFQPKISEYRSPLVLERISPTQENKPLAKSAYHVQSKPDRRDSGSLRFAGLADRRPMAASGQNPHGGRRSRESNRAVCLLPAGVPSCA